MNRSYWIAASKFNWRLHILKKDRGTREEALISSRQVKSNEVRTLFRRKFHDKLIPYTALFLVHALNFDTHSLEAGENLEILSQVEESLTFHPIFLKSRISSGLFCSQPRYFS